MFFLGFYISKIIRLILKVFNKNATTLPGKIAIKICPNFISKIAKPKIIIGVTGTNGKTTVCNLLNSFFEKNGYKVINNKFGSNLNSGIASSFISGANLLNKCNYDIAVLEIDERSAPKILPFLKLDYFICTNLFRDSIRREANPDFICDLLDKYINKDTKLILNADDLISSSIGKENDKVYFGISKLKTDKTVINNIVCDVRICPNCHEKLKYNYIKYHHLGNAYCPNCGFKSQKADYLVTDVDLNNENITVKYKNEIYNYHLINNSIFNAYNMIMVISLLKELNIENDKITKFFENEEIVESRYRKDIVNDTNIITIMAKGQNAIACSCVFEYVKKEPNKKEIILILYDLFDNKTSSENLAWIYDCDFEFLNDENIDKVIIGGPRCEDFYLRLLLAGVPKEKLFMTKDELKTVDYLSLEKGKDIYLLYELYDYKISNDVRLKVINNLIKGGNKND